MANSIQTIMRMSAVIYADQQQTTRSAKTVERIFIEAVLVNAKNTPLTIEQILMALQEDFSLTYQELEIRSVVNDEAYFTCILAPKDRDYTYYLPHSRYERLLQKGDKGIEQVVEMYIAREKNDIDPVALKELLYKYLYNLLNTNINAFRQLLEKKSKNVSSVIDSDIFDETEIDYINDFLNWDNDAKDEALFALISCCVDYASAINKVDQNEVVKALRNKCLYLDNSLLYRALGINGSFRQSRVNNLLQRCIQSGQKLYVSSITRKEFFDTISYHINELNKTTPYGHINPQLFYKYAYGHSFYQYYHEWRKDRDTYGFKSLELFMHSEYDNLLKRFGIQEDFKKPFNEENEAQTIDRYTEEIQQHKVKKQQHLHENDACNMLWIEKSRGGNDHGIRDTKYYFVTSDRRLQEWDLSHSQNQPITMLPSQWLALLLKFYSRSVDDYKCFVSFLTISKEKADISAAELQQTLAGISEITEDFKLQDDIISALLEIEDNNQYRTREAAKKFAKEKLEANYIAQIQANEEKHQQEIEAVKKTTQQEIEAQKQEADRFIKIMQSEFEKRDRQLRKEKLEERANNLELQIKNLQNTEKLIEKITDDKCKKVKRSIGVGYAIFAVIWIALIIKIGWQKMAMYTYIFTFIVAAVPFVISFVLDKTVNLKTMLRNYRSRVYDNNCRLYNFDKSMILDCALTLDSVRKQLEEFAD